jgi:hypothetical protein
VVRSPVLQFTTSAKSRRGTRVSLDHAQESEAGNLIKAPAPNPARDAVGRQDLERDRRADNEQQQVALGSEHSYLDGPGEGEGGRSGDGGHVGQTGTERGGGGGHEERESDGGRWLAWPLLGRLELEQSGLWPERALYTRRGGGAAAARIGSIDGRRGPRGREAGPAAQAGSWAVGPCGSDESI